MTNSFCSWRLSKHQSPTTVLFRTTLTWTITQYELVWYFWVQTSYKATDMYMYWFANQKSETNHKLRLAQGEQNLRAVFEVWKSLYLVFFKNTDLIVYKWSALFCYEIKMCNSRNIHTSPTEGIFSKTLPPLWKFQSLLWREYGYFLELHNYC